MAATRIQRTQRAVAKEAKAQATMEKMKRNIAATRIQRSYMATKEAKVQATMENLKRNMAATRIQRSYMAAKDRRGSTTQPQRPLSAFAAYRAILGDGAEWIGSEAALKDKLLWEHAYGHYWLEAWLQDYGVSLGRGCHVYNPKVRKVQDMYREEKEQRRWAELDARRKAEVERLQAQAAVANRELEKEIAAEARRLDLLEAEQREREAAAQAAPHRTHDAEILAW